MKPDYTLPLDQLPNPLPIVPLEKPFDVVMTPPGSKSITNRAYVLAALADGESKIIRPLRSDDCDLLLDALCTLGAQARWDGDDVYITGVNGRFPRGGAVNLGDGGTPTRFMIAAACLAAEPVVIDGSKRMRERPIAEGVEMLRQLGAEIEYVEEEGRLPVRVDGRSGIGGRIEIGETASSQFISAILLIGWCAHSPLVIVHGPYATSMSYIGLTLSVLNQWCMLPRVQWIREDPIRREIGFEPRSFEGRTIEGETDASSGIYWQCAAALVLNATAQVLGYGDSSQPDAQVFMNCLVSKGPRVQWAVEDGTAEPLIVTGTGIIRGGAMHCDNTPDGAMAVAVVAACADSPTELLGLRTLRVKETDRIAALAAELRKVGCEVETTDDSMTIHPMPEDSRSSIADPVIIETYNDHRMAMAFAILGLVRPGILIKDPAVVSKSYPGFWKDFARLYQ